MPKPPSSSVPWMLRSLLRDLLACDLKEPFERGLASRPITASSHDSDCFAGACHLCDKRRLTAADALYRQGDQVAQTFVRQKLGNWREKLLDSSLSFCPQLCFVCYPVAYANWAVLSTPALHVWVITR